LRSDSAIISGEDERLRHRNGSFADLLAVDIERNLSALAETAAGIGKLLAHLVLARRQRPGGFHIVVVYPRDVLPIDDRTVEKFNPDTAGRPVLIKGNTQLLFSGMGRLSDNCSST